MNHRIAPKQILKNEKEEEEDRHRRYLISYLSVYLSPPCPLLTFYLQQQ
jgi:hypothetical protein